jgi:hypothetical protein
MTMQNIRTDSFEFDVTDRGAGEALDRELSRTSVPQSIQIADRATMLRDPAPVPAGLSLPAIAAAMSELVRVRAAFAAAKVALNAAENRRRAAAAKDAAAGAAAFSSGTDATGESAVANLEKEIVELAAHREAGAAAVWIAEEGLLAAIEADRTGTAALLAAAVEGSRVTALEALSVFEASRDELLSTLNFQSWLSGTRKWRLTFGPLHGVGQPPPTPADVVGALKRQLTWG